jgi:hypothetical protein
MRLLNSSTLELSEFFGSTIPEYVILSHVWGVDEVSFQEIQENTTATQSKAGFLKIKECCSLAARDGFEWVWIDTCCIDKSSSAELQEAINSMYQWYRRAQICYAYLQDVVPGPRSAISTQFRNSKWLVNFNTDMGDFQT